MGVIVSEHYHATTRWGNCHVIHRGHSQLPAVSRVNGERDKWTRMHQFSYVASHVSRLARRPK